MPFTVSQYLALRPYAYHVTASENLPVLRNRGRAYPAAELLKLGNRLDLLRERRETHVPVSFDDHIILLKDQRPLIEKNADLAEGWDFGDFVEYLNDHVFFWPGTDTRATGPGRRLLEHYASEGPAILRVPTRQLFDVNSSITPLYCAFNSGAPRQQSGKRVQRGSDLFMPVHLFSRRASEVVELGFREEVTLPVETESFNGAEWIRMLD